MKALLGAAGIALVVVGAFCLWRTEVRGLTVTPASSVDGTTAGMVVLPGDGREHLAAIVSRSAWLGLRWGSLEAASVEATGGFDGVRPQPAGRKIEIWLRTPVVPGKRRLLVLARGRSAAIPVDIRADDAGDAAGDGLPDWMPLHSERDRLAFRGWFTELAERAAAAAPAKLPAEVTDCASLLRYAYREALKRHDDKWYAQFSADQMPPLTSVEQWSYPNTPLGMGLFRTTRGAYEPGQAADGTFSQFADAKTLMTANAFLVGRDVRDARPGDLIFYRQLEQNSPYHSMIITGEHGEWVVYHTGPIGSGRGEMRRMAIADLMQHPDVRWRPLAENSNFLGVYRWNILRDTE
jgi:uncharacterized protein